MNVASELLPSNQLSSYAVSAEPFYLPIKD